MASRDFVKFAYSIANTASVDQLVEEYFQRNPKARRPGDPTSTPEQEEKARKAVANRADEYSDAIELARMLVRLGLGEVKMFLEYELYQPDKGANIGPVDVLLAGIDPETGEPGYVIVELKRWSKADPDPDDPGRVRHYYSSKHPAVQVTQHKVNMMFHLSLFADRFIRLSAAAYLPKLKAAEGQWIRKAPAQTEADVFTGANIKAFEQYLARKLSPDAQGRAAKMLEDSPVQGKRVLEDEIGEIMRGRSKFAMTASQTIAYDAIVEWLENWDGLRTRVALVEGGAGTGKTVLATELAHHAAAGTRKLRWLFTSGSRASLNALRSGAKGFGKHFVPLIQIARDHEPNELDVVICDEAQALRDHPVFDNAGTKWEAETTMEVLLSRARVVILLSDARQRVRPYEVWDPETIAMSVPETDEIEFRRFPLDVQLRAVNGHSYQTWVRRLLDGERPQPLAYDPDESFQAYVADSPAAMESFLRARLEETGKVRMTCGFTFPWTKYGKGDPLPHDVRIGDWSYPWNARPEAATPSIPPMAKWAVGEGGFEQMGSIYAARGHEYKWGGVILGPDLLWRGGRWVSDMQASYDRRAKRVGDSEFGAQIRRTYQTLLTRSMLGTVVYSTDPETREMLKSLLPQLPAPAA